MIITGKIATAWQPNDTGRSIQFYRKLASFLNKQRPNHIIDNKYNVLFLVTIWEVEAKGNKQIAKDKKREHHAHQLFDVNEKKTVFGDSAKTAFIVVTSDRHIVSVNHT